MSESSPGSQTETATLGGGCFWCLEAVFAMTEGVRAVRSGYMGGHTVAPSYEEVCTGNTGHAEVVRVSFDPNALAYRELLEIFFGIHDPTTPDRQGNDVGPQYRSVIFHHDERQRRIATEVIAELEEDGPWDAPIVTELRPEAAFYPAEAYHDRYFERNGSQPYCRAVIAPKVARYRQRFRHRIKAADAE